MESGRRTAGVWFPIPDYADAKENCGPALCFASSTVHRPRPALQIDTASARWLQLAVRREAISLQRSRTGGPGSVPPARPPGRRYPIDPFGILKQFAGLTESGTSIRPHPIDPLEGY